MYDLFSYKEGVLLSGVQYGFSGLLTRFLRSNGVEEEELDYRPVVDTHAVDVSRMKGLDGAHRPVLTMPKYQARNDEILSHMYKLQML